MNRFTKVAVSLLLTLPLGAYIAGTLVAAQTDMPDRRSPVVVEGTPSPLPPSSKPSSPVTPTPAPGGEGDDEEEVRVIRPSPRDVDDDRDDRERGGPDDTDDREHGGRDDTDDGDDDD